MGVSMFVFRLDNTNTGTKWNTVKCNSNIFVNTQATSPDIIFFGESNALQFKTANNFVTVSYIKRDNFNPDPTSAQMGVISSDTKL